MRFRSQPSCETVAGRFGSSLPVASTGRHRRPERRCAAGVVLALALCCSSSLFQPALAVELFGPGLSLPVRPSPTAIAVGDFNGDGFADLATPHACCHVSVLLADGVGGFSDARETSVASGLRSLAVGDFDLDGALDLATVSLIEGVSILLGDGQGNFNLGDSIPVGTLPRSLAAGDFNADGRADLAVAVSGQDLVSILLGDGQGGFSDGLDIAVGDNPWAVAVGDFNDDGADDLAVGNLADDSVSIFLSLGDAGFKLSDEVLVGDGPRYLAVGDFDADGAVDLAVAEIFGGSLSILEGNGQGDFDRATSDLPLGGGPVWIAVADVDADQDLDLAVVGDTVSLLRGDGAGGFAKGPDIEGNDDPVAVAVLDADGDGAADLLVVNQNISGDSTGSVNVLPGDGIGGFVAAPEFAVGPIVTQFPWGCVVSNDFNGDTHADLAVTSRFADSVSIHLGDGLGGFSAAADVEVADPACLSAVDIDGDGAIDLAVAQFNFELVSVLLGDGEGGFVHAQSIPVGAQPIRIATGDFNADGRVDLAVANAGGSSMSILLGDEEGNLIPMPELPSCGGSVCLPTHSSVADFNGDGAPDLAVANWASQTLAILSGNGEGHFTLELEIDAGFTPEWVFVSDFRRDGVLDLVAGGGHTSVRTWLGKVAGGFATGPIVDVVWANGFPTLADFNADGEMDLAMPIDPSNSALILLGDGDGGFLETPQAALGSSPFTSTAGDFNEDGVPDLALVSFADSLSILLNRLDDRADVNGSNRIDGFDINAIGRLAGLPADDPEYRRNVDADENGVIDGDDLALVCSRFGEFRKQASPLRATLVDPLPSAPDTVTFQPLATEGDRLTVQVLVGESQALASGAHFAVTFGPPGEASEQILEWVGFDQGTYLSGGVIQLYTVAAEAPGRVEVEALRFPVEDSAASGQQPLMNLIFRARKEGSAVLEFVTAEGQTQPSLLNAANEEVAGVEFVGGVTVNVGTTVEGAPGQRIGVSPDELDFGEVSVGAVARRKLRLSNFGFSELEISGVEVGPPFRSFFTSEFSIPPFGFVDLWVEFQPTSVGQFTAELFIDNNDEKQPEFRVPLLGGAETGDE